MNEPVIVAPSWPRCTRCTKPCKPAEQVVYEGRPFCCSDCVIVPEGTVSQAALRVEVFTRDHGRCALCSLDVTDVEHTRDELYAARRNPGDQGYDTFERLWKGHLDVLERAGFDRRRAEDLSSLWDADHIDPRVKGGATNLGNARTLCIPCHRSVTAELARERGALRRGTRR